MYIRGNMSRTHRSLALHYRGVHMTQWSQLATPDFLARRQTPLQLTSGSLLSTKLSSIKIASIAVISACSNLPHCRSCAGGKSASLLIYFCLEVWLGLRRGPGQQLHPPSQ